MRIRRPDSFSSPPLSSSPSTAQGTSLPRCRWVRRFCRNDWLIVHHINIETWHLLVPRCRRAPPAAAYTGFEED